MKKVVLIVEDEPALRRALRRILLREEYHVSEVACVEAALSVIAERETLDVVLTDYDLPDGLGDEVVRAAQARGVPVVMMTGGNKRAPAGVALLEKPFELDAMIAKLSEVVGSAIATPPLAK